jgi:hypothetical protein
MADFKDAMINVRSAFRLLYFFNDCILSLMEYIEKTFGIPCVWDKAHWIEPPIQNKKIFQCAGGHGMSMNGVRLILFWMLINQNKAIIRCSKSKRMGYRRPTYR